MTAGKSFAAGAALLLAFSWGGAASAAEGMASLGLHWVEYGVAPGDCLLLVTDGSKPVINPWSKNAYAIRGPGGCPPKLQDGAELSAYDSYTFAGGGLRLYAPWGRTNIFRHYPQFERWGYGMKYRFDWHEGPGS